MEISISIEHLTREANLREGAVRILKRQLHYRFGKLSPTIERHLDEASVGQLERWAASVLEANRLEDIFTLNIGKRLEICNEHLRCRASRIGDGRYVSLARQCLSIEVDYALWWELGRDSKDRESWMNLAKFYAAFSEAFGECGTRYYDWKGAFNFAFEVDVFNGETPNQYLLNVVNFRNTVEFRYGKIIPDTETRYDRHIMHAPFDEEFSAKQMGTLSAFLWGYAEGFLETACQRPYGRDFIKEVGSNLILFGCHGGVFFQQHFEDEDTFNLEKSKLRNHNLNTIENKTQGVARGAEHVS